MEERLKKYACDLVEGNNILAVYEDLAKIFDENCLFHEEGAILEKIWHITQKHEIYKEIGDIFFYKVRNKDISISAYNRFLQYSNPDFYRSYADNLSQLGYKNFGFEYDNEDYGRELVNLCDRYNAIIYIIICLHKNKKYSEVVEFKTYLNKLREFIDAFPKSSSEEDLDLVNEIKISNKHLSEILSETEHHYDINYFAIELDQDNEKAYINILGDYITYKDYQSAVSFYDAVYAPNFNKTFTTDISAICWQISDFYRDRYEFYNAVLFQKSALEIDLGEK